MNVVPVEGVFKEFFEALGRYDFSLAHRILRFNNVIKIYS